MKIKTLITVCLLFCATQAAAETRYITDRINATFRTGPGNQYAIVKSLPSGTAVELIEPGEKWSRVSDASGTEGWVLTQWLVTRLSAGSGSNKQLATAQAELAALKTENTALKSKVDELLKATDASGESYQELKAKSATLQQLEADYKEAKSQLDALSKKTDDLNDSLARKNMIWFLSGAGVLLVGFLIGSSSRKKRSSYY